jgi:4a-hydroxytetrahydrobiopterin dehydratase
MDTLSNEQIRAADLADWRKLGQALHARFAVDLGAAGDFVAAVGRLPGAVDHAPDLRITQGAVDVTVCTRQDGRWVTTSDLELARAISGVAHDQGLTAEPGAVTQLELALDTAHDDVVAPFWAALLTGSTDNRVHDSVFDPTDRVPSLWFQGTDPHEPPRQRWHFDLWLAPEVADGRIAAAVAAGGSVVDDAQAPAFTVLADPDGNRVCVCTSLSRD